MELKKKQMNSTIWFQMGDVMLKQAKILGA